MKRYLLSLVLGVIAAFAGTAGLDTPEARAAASLVLVAHGQAKAEIVIADEPADTAVQAAAALRLQVKEMTGAVLSVKKESEYDGKTKAVLVGMSGLAKRMGVDVTQNIDQGDHYVIRTDKEHKYLALVGNDDGGLRGSLYAVYDLLQRQGCGWYGPEPLWQIIPR